MALPYDPAIPLLGNYPKEMKSAYRKDTCISMSIVIHTHCGAIKKNEIMLFAGKQMEFSGSSTNIKDAFVTKTVSE